MVATARLPKPTKPTKAPRFSLYEDVARGFRPLKTGETRVDREAGIIRGVKILGLESPSHNRRYTAEAIRQGAPLYEGAKVFHDHPKDKDIRKHRSVTEAFAWLENVQPGADGLYADLRIVNPRDPSQLAKNLFWLAENKPDFFAFSHNADGEGPRDPRTGVVTINRILEVRSVDLVMEGATTKSLFESENTVPQTTLRKLIETLKVPAALAAKYRTLLEQMPGEMGDMPMDEPPEPAAPTEGDWRVTLGKVAGDLLASEDPEAHEIAKKIVAMLKPASAAEPVAEEEEEEKKEDDKEKDKPKMEGKKPAVPAPDVITLTEAKSLCKLAGLTEDAGLLAMLDGSPRPKALSLLEWAQKKAAPPARTTTPRSQGPGGTTPQKPDDVPADRAAFLKRLRPAQLVSA